MTAPTRQLQPAPVQIAAEPAAPAWNAVLLAEYWAWRHRWRHWLAAPAEPLVALAVTLVGAALLLPVLRAVAHDFLARLGPVWQRHEGLVTIAAAVLGAVDAAVCLYRWQPPAWLAAEAGIRQHHAVVRSLRLTVRLLLLIAVLMSVVGLLRADFLPMPSRDGQIRLLAALGAGYGGVSLLATLAAPYLAHRRGRASAHAVAAAVAGSHPGALWLWQWQAMRGAWRSQLAAWATAPGLLLLPGGERLHVTVILLAVAWALGLGWASWRSALAVIVKADRWLRTQPLTAWGLLRRLLAMPALAAAGGIVFPALGLRMAGVPAGPVLLTMLFFAALAGLQLACVCASRRRPRAVVLSLQHGLLWIFVLQALPVLAPCVWLLQIAVLTRQALRA